MFGFCGFKFFSVFDYSDLGAAHSEVKNLEKKLNKKKQQKHGNAQIRKWMFCCCSWKQWFRYKFKMNIGYLYLSLR